MKVIRIKFTLPAVLSLLVLLPGPSSAGAPRTHDGFFLRLSAGGGYASTEIDNSANRFKMSGASGDANLAIGGAVSENLILHATMGIHSPDGPDRGSFRGRVRIGPRCFPGSHGRQGMVGRKQLGVGPGRLR